MEETPQSPSHDPCSTSMFSSPTDETATNSTSPEGDSIDIATSQRQTSLNQNSSWPAEGGTISNDGSVTLPGDDGMRKLRSQIHIIREMALSSEEKAKRMHALMVADYEVLKSRSKSDTRVTHIEDISHLDLAERDPASELLVPTQSSEDHDLVFILPEDLEPTYYPEIINESKTSQAQESDDFNENEPVLGCPHYMRNVKIQCRDCKKWYTCRHCHNLAESHTVNRKSIKNMLCMLCGHPQKAGEYCERCGELTAAYYCNICKLWENDTGKSIYHCDDCGICRRGEGLGRDFVHCKKCNVCISIGWIGAHKCVERATECDCPICSLWLFTSSEAVVSMRCGHYIHRQCYDDYMKRSYKCPICNRSAVNMELQWRKLDQAIMAQPMPRTFSETKVLITCNDCAARTCTSYHWLGNKCTVCDSYNTNKIKLINSPSDEELEAIANTSEAIELRRIGRSISDTNQPPITTSADPAETHDFPIDQAADAGTGETRGPFHVSTGMSSATMDDNINTQHNNMELQTEIQDTTVESEPSQPAINLSAPGPDPSSALVAAHFDTSITRRHDNEQVSERNNDDGNTNEEQGGEEDDDDVSFWGEGISPSSWSLPLSISPMSMSGWTSPGFFATRIGNAYGERQREQQLEAIEDDDDDSDWSTNESDADETVDLDNDIDEIELLGHR